MDKITISLATLAEVGLTVAFVVGVIAVSKRSAGGGSPDSSAASKKKKGKGKRKGIVQPAEEAELAPEPVKADNSAAKKRKPANKGPTPVAVAVPSPPPAPTPVPVIIPKVVKPTQAAAKKAKKAAATPVPAPAPVPVSIDASTSSDSEDSEDEPTVLRIGKQKISSDGWEEWPSLSSKPEGPGEDDGWEVAKPKSASTDSACALYR